MLGGSSGGKEDGIHGGTDNSATASTPPCLDLATNRQQRAPSDADSDTPQLGTTRIWIKKSSTIIDSVSNHTGSGSHISFVEHQVRRERASSFADESIHLGESATGSAGRGVATAQSPPRVVQAPSTSSPLRPPSSSTATTSAEGDENGVDAEEELDDDDDASTSLVPADQERQLILLMLLAQVCALHDPTPRTFTVHVLELFERGILDRQSIHFLYDLGLVPNTTSFPSPVAPPLLLEQGDDNEHDINVEPIVTTDHDADEGSLHSTGTATHRDATIGAEAASGETALAAVADSTLALVEKRLPTTSAPQHSKRMQLLRQRSAEASAIRSTLEYHEQMHLQKTAAEAAANAQRANAAAAARPAAAAATPSSIPSHPTDAPQSPSHQHNQQQGQQASWSVDQHPLSLSRYQREFEQVELLASGSFGHVYRVVHKMDGREYAVKCVSFSAAGYSRDAVQQVVREVHCLAACDHPHVVRYYTSWLEPSWMTGSNPCGPTNETMGRDDTHGKSDNASSSREGTNSADFVGGLRDNKSHLKLLSDIQRLITSGDHSDEELSNNLKSYFRDPSFGLRPAVNSHRSSRSSNSSSWSGEETGDDDSLTSSWGDGLQEYSEWTVEQSTDEEGHENHQQRALIKHNRMPHNRRGNARESPQAGLSKYRYQISLYIQMQLCCPATLADWIRSRNQTMKGCTIGDRMEAAAEIFGQIVDGLHHVHEVGGIVHRDLKPANVFAGSDGLHFKIGDFGLSKVIQSGPKRSTDLAIRRAGDGRGRNHQPRQQPVLLLTHDEGAPCDPNAGQSSMENSEWMAEPAATASTWRDPLTAGVGTASYAAPEQVQSQNYGTPADIFSLGLILLELLCCFSTEHERLQTFHDCRHRRTLPNEFSDHPLAARAILACTEPKAALRPTACELKALTFQTYPIPVPLSPANDDDVVSRLQKLVEKKDKELEECKRELARKDEIIEQLRAQQDATLSTAEPN